MRLHAYVLAGDPAWATESLTSYYPLVDRVVVSFDRGHLSWSGRPMPVEAAIANLRLADPDGKIVLAPGNYSDPSRPFLDSETDQRQAALDAASEGADWVLQLDTDEIALDAGGRRRSTTRSVTCTSRSAPGATSNTAGGSGSSRPPIPGLSP